MTANTTHLAENISLENFESKETAFARELAERIHRLHNRKLNSQNNSGSIPAKSTKPAAQRMTFNPLHPSMELPPEQLIRLMGMHSQQMAIETRKNKGRNTSVRHRDTSRLDGDYSDEEASPQSYIRLSLLILTLVCVSAYFTLGKTGIDPARFIISQSSIEQNPLTAVTPTQQLTISEPVNTINPVKTADIKKTPVSSTVKQPIIATEITKSIDVPVNTIETSNEILVTEPESETASDLIEKLPGQEPEVSGILESADSNLTENIIAPTTNSVKSAEDTTQVEVMDMSEINQAITNNQDPVETTSPAMFEDAYPEDL
ncbi:MAG: hypothetical protein V3V50_01355 [Gammaproteobacteria bacterium]